MAISLTSLSSEVLLRILGSFDDARDLVRFRQISRRFYNVGGDALLWRDIFVHTYLRSSTPRPLQPKSPQSKRQRLSSSRGRTEQDDGAASISARVIKGLPMIQELSSSIPDDEFRDDRKVDWYTLFKVSRNWQTGNYSSRQLQILQSSGQGSNDAIAGPSRLNCDATEQHQLPQTLIDSTSSHIFASMQSPSSENDIGSPVLLVFPSKSRDDNSSTRDRSQEPLARFKSPKILQRSRITSLAVDRGHIHKSTVRLFLGYSTGDSLLLYYDTASNTFHDEIHIETEEADCIVSAALHYPMLVTCTIDFKIRLYHISGDAIRLIEERRSYCCHWPASLKLEPLISKRGDLKQRLSIAYSSPVYPIGWTVGLQEIIIDAQSSIMSRSASARRSHVVTRLDSAKEKDEMKGLLGCTSNLQERRKQVGRLTSLSYEEPFIVVGTKDNDVVCFKVAGSIKKDAETRDEAIGDLELNHVCTFQGHTGTVHSVSLNEGRCVTGGSDGSVRVWRLGDEEAAVAKAARLLTTIDASLRKGLGKVVTMGATLTSSKRKRESKEEQHRPPLSLSDILKEAQLASGSTKRNTSSSAVVRLVTSAFDHIISVSAIKSSTFAKINTPNGSNACRTEFSIDREEQEQVQIWNFAR